VPLGPGPFLLLSSLSFLPKLNEKQIREIKTPLTDPATQVKDAAERYGVSRTTLYKRVGVVQPLKQVQPIEIYPQP
jgi:ACT domain-containing protein